MPIELVLSPIMRPVVRAKSLLFAPHRRASRYIPHIVELDEVKSSRYAIRRRFGTGSKILDVYDTKAEGSGPNGPTEQSKSIFWFDRSRAVKGAYKMFSSDIRATGPNSEDEPCATLRAGLRSNVLLIRAPEAPVAELGWHVISHRVDALDAYRMFTLADGATYQWTTKGKFLEKVRNVGEKESEVRERIGQVISAGGTGFDLIVDESKIPREMALASAMCSYIDHWNTNLDFGGIYNARQPGHVRWKRD
ncbi:DEKNAAC101334 [Brettanomyces naardenensis]|uniref:DEKNAAC101334 n=1 Tax=Brettanomyces naardenensis TaxID=13370 RepID=A0A448YHV8_BRENA|nr:DEKNAAC101334 [Brettanomyces naardenensis]